ALPELLYFPLFERLSSRALSLSKASRSAKRRSRSSKACLTNGCKPMRSRSSASWDELSMVRANHSSDPLRIPKKQHRPPIWPLLPKNSPFRVRCFQPLSHLSEAASGSAVCLGTQAILADSLLPRRHAAVLFFNSG